MRGLAGPRQPPGTRPPLRLSGAPPPPTFWLRSGPSPGPPPSSCTDLGLAVSSLLSPHRGSSESRQPYFDADFLPSIFTVGSVLNNFMSHFFLPLSFICIS